MRLFFVIMESTQRKHTVVREQAAVLADRIVQDIADRGLRVGDRYLTTAEAAQYFHVRRATANMAMSKLAARGVLVRRLRSGTFVGRQAIGGVETQVKTLYLVESVERLHHYPPLYETVGLIRQRLPGASIHMSAVPSHGALDYACDLMRHARSAGNALGFLLISCPRDVYRYFAESELPAVVLSDVYTESDSLTTMSGDQRLAGTLLADHLLKAGHKRIALLTHSRWLAGDNRFLEGITQSLEAAKMPQGTLVVRSMSEDPNEFMHDTAEFWAAENRPTGVICRTLTQADSVARVARAIGGDKVGMPEIVFGVVTGRLSDDCPFLYALEQDLAAQICRALDVLADISRLSVARGQHIRLPIELVSPRRHKKAELG